ncbi:cell adhesion molecule Dscam2-like [Achroia grisella]|uniref:cell adhesion molecule Dscam2-like n=1 Tax=Achroia grisella TaxID=688607 RepID=UPI0027D2BEEF|nr:cell adhesion molecule Dscam2-like [Achroia grisella]
MCSWVVTALIILYAMGGEGQEHGPVFLMEPPPRLVFSNSTGARVSCAAHGFPAPQLAWQQPDGAQLDDVPGLRQVLDNGTLVLLPFPATQYRPDIHSTVYRCRAHNAHGAILSRDMRTQAVVWQEWRVRVTSTQAEAGGPALLTCVVPAALREHASVAAWYRNDAVLPAADHLSGSTLLVGDGWKLIVRSVGIEDSNAQYSCSVLDSLTGERRQSAPVSIDASPMSVASAPRSITHGQWEASVRRGGDVALPCLVHASPPASITWYRETGGGVLREVRDNEGAGRYTRTHDALAIRRAEIADGGRWACRAANPHGHLTLRLHLAVHAHLTVHAQPHTQVVNSGGTAMINCTWGGWPAPRLEWLHNGVPLGAGVAGGRVHIQSNGEQLIITAVHRADKGVYQCMARNERDSAQASAELRLGDTAPELQYTFIEQVLRPGQVVTLKCSAVGSPPPHFTWMLDGQPLNTIAMGPRFSVEQFATKANDVVSYLNISAVTSDDGGLYTCRAANSLGEVAHTSRLNIYGPPYVRSLAPIRAVAGRELMLYCPYSGYPISSVKWHRDGQPVEWDSSVDGALRVARVEPSHAGTYTCLVMGAHGETARRELQLVVSNPPEIEPFSFSANLQEGKRAQVSCSVTSGDMPVHFTWLKDNAPIPTSLQVEERAADFFSNLVFKEVSARHSGLYTCVASNSAAKVNYTAELVVKVSPKWVVEPKDEAVLAGEALALHCQTTGSPSPQVTWLKQRGSSSTDFVPLVNLGGRFQLLTNGTLWIESALPYDEGHYICKSENGVAPSLSKSIAVAVNEPARFELTSHNMTARRGAAATLACDVRGDGPIRVTWAHNTNHLDLNTYRLSISEAKTDSGLRSQLYISRADREDSGVYKCQAVNAYGHSDHYIYLSVQEKPDTPHSLSVTEILSRAVRLSWSQGFDGNSPLVGYTLQYCVLSAQGSIRVNQWDTATSLNVSVHGTPHTTVILTKKGDIHYEALLNTLKPHTAYMIRIAAINQIDRSAFTEPVVVKTQEEAPSEAPTNVQVTAGGAGELHVSWRPPPRDAWHGELLGYSVTCTELTTPGASHRNITRTLTVNGWSATELNLSALRKFTRYEVRVRAFNGVAAGPASAPVSATTLEGVPESHPITVSCFPLSSSSMKVTWNPPPIGQHGGLIQGYKVVYSPFTSDEADIGEIKRVTTTDTYLHTLRKYTNYSIQVLAFTNAGDGKRSPPVYCMTEEDVPSAPEKIKALAYSSDTVLVSWLPPIHPNGIISHYTVYYREAGRLGKHSSFTVTADKNADVDLMFQVRNLMETQLYEFWVSATTGSGEGESTLVVGQGPASRVPARIASFGREVRVARGRGAVLRCSCVGAPPPRSRWAHARRPVTHHAHYQVTHAGHLRLRGQYSRSLPPTTRLAPPRHAPRALPGHARRPPAAAGSVLTLTTAHYAPRAAPSRTTRTTRSRTPATCGCGVSTHAHYRPLRASRRPVTHHAHYQVTHAGHLRLRGQYSRSLPPTTRLAPPRHAPRALPGHARRPPAAAGSVLTLTTAHYAPRAAPSRTTRTTRSRTPATCGCGVSTHAHYRPLRASRRPVTHHAHYQVTHAGHLRLRGQYSRSLPPTSRLAPPVLRCGCMGAPSLQNSSLNNQKRKIITMMITQYLNEQSSGNFSCTASNTIGEDTIVYVVSAVLPPAAPALSLQYTTSSSIKLHWQIPGETTDPILGYILHHKQNTDTDWNTVELTPEVTSYTMDMLKCGTTYNAKIQARNKISIGPPSEVLSATTRGGRPKPPKPEDHVHMNSTAIKINFYAWRDGGCPILGFRVSYRRVGTEHWIKIGDGLNSASHVVGDLSPGTWYELTVEAYSDAGVERVTLRVDTHTLAGGTNSWIF